MDIPVAAPPLSYRPGLQPKGWIVVEQTESQVELRDPDLSMAEVARKGVALVVLALIVFGCVALLEWTHPPWPIRILEGFGLFLGLALLWCLWVRWRTPCIVRIADGRFHLWSRRGQTTSEMDCDVNDITSLETAHNSPTFHSHYSFRVHLRDSSRHCFLHCSNGSEANWILALINAAIAKEQNAGCLVDVAADLQPAALQTTLPPPMLADAPPRMQPPPLPTNPDIVLTPAQMAEALGLRVEAIEAKVIAPAPQKKESDPAPQQTH
jgi:hypothetical protein